MAKASESTTVKWLIGIFITLAVTAAGSWGAYITTHSNDHENKITIIETNYTHLNDTLKEIKNDVKEIKRLIKIP